jgi:hypothetical protein
MTPKQKFEHTENLTFVRVAAPDRIQFWCEELKMSIFVTDQGIEAAGPDSGCAFVTMLTADRFQSLPNTEASRGA